MVPKNSVVNIDGISHWRCSMKKGALKHFAKFIGKHQCQSLFFNKKETLVQVFSFEFCGIFKNTYFTEHLRITAAVRFWTSTSFKIMTCIVEGMDNILMFFFFSGSNAQIGLVSAAFTAAFVVIIMLAYAVYHLHNAKKNT